MGERGQGKTRQVGTMKARTAVIPFFRGTAVGDMFFSLAFFGTPGFLMALSGWMHKSGDHTTAA
jgi:hypothetical protein